jgi:hypothetical protein
MRFTRSGRWRADGYGLADGDGQAADGAVLVRGQWLFHFLGPEHDHDVVGLHVLAVLRRKLDPGTGVACATGC